MVGRFFSLVMVFVLLLSQQVLALTPKEQKGVKVLKAPSLVYESPERATPFSLDQAPDDIDYRTSILPYDQDRDAPMYIVLPTLGIVTPVVFVPENTKDFTDMFQGKLIDINKYLTRGVMHYPSTGIPGEEGNPVIFGHSNFYKDAPGDYKAIFADIMNLDVSDRDEIWVFVQEDDGEYDLRKFSIEASFETVPTDVEIMIPQGGKEITVFACTNGLEGRWILKGKLIPPTEVLITYPMKWELADLTEKIASLPPSDKSEGLSTALTKIEEIRASTDTSTYHDKYKHYVLDYIERQIAEM